MERLERLVNLVAALLDAQRPLTREQIRSRIGGYSEDEAAFRRNFERDKDLLRQMGIPVIVESVESDEPDGAYGYRIPPERYELPDPGLSADELAALRLAVSAIAVEGGESSSPAAMALSKLSAVGQPSASNSSDSVEGGVATSVNPVQDADIGHLAMLEADERVGALFGAISQRQVASFDYRGDRRKVEPWALSYRLGAWYLSAWDHLREAERVFRVDRIEGGVEVEESPGAFERPERGEVWSGPPPPWQLGTDDEMTMVRLRVDSEHAKRAEQDLGEATVAEVSEAETIFDVPVNDIAAFRSFVLGFLDHAEILSPQHARQDMISWLESLTVREPQ